MGGPMTSLASREVYKTAGHGYYCTGAPHFDACLCTLKRGTA